VNAAHLRPGVPADIPQLAEIFVAAFQRGYPAVLPADVLAGVDVPTVTGWFRRWAATDRLQTVVAEVDGVPRGFVRFGDDPSDDDTAVGYVAALYVHPDVAGAGLGRLLLNHAVRSFAGGHRVAVRLWVFERNQRARGLYASAGFVPDGLELTDPQWRVPQIRLRKELADA
jgi:GNAT superfamily N-acetyltransferase